MPLGSFARCELPQESSRPPSNNRNEIALSLIVDATDHQQELFMLPFTRVDIMTDVSTENTPAPLPESTPVRGIAGESPTATVNSPYPNGSAEESANEPRQGDDMLVVVFALAERLGSIDVMDAMWPIEERAIEAIDASGLGFLDGNDIGAGEYGICFFGGDWKAMWELLKPIMQTAPVPLDRLEIWPRGASDMSVVSAND